MLELTAAEIIALDGILRTEIMEVKELIESLTGSDKFEMIKHLKNVESIFNKLNK